MTTMYNVLNVITMLLGKEKILLYKPISISISTRKDIYIEEKMWWRKMKLSEPLMERH